MSQITQRIDNLARREATTLAASTTQRVFASVSTPAPPNRQAVNLNNCDASAELYVAFTAAGASAPSLDAATADVIVPPKSARQFQIGTNIDVWIRHSGTGSIAYTALELC